MLKTLRNNQKVPDLIVHNTWYIPIAHDFEYSRASKYFQLWKTIELIHSVIDSIESVKW
jgi:hypothetical protein